ncbi:TRAP transporter large permease subunit, partial [Thalassospira xiamenensis]
MENFYIEDWFPLIMFASLGILVFSGLPVAFVISGIGIAFGFLGMAYDVFSFIEFFNIVSRIWGGIAENMVMVAVPMFIYMGTMLEKSGVAEDLLECLNVLMRKVPGGLALSVTLMGTIMAATTGIIGASVVMMTLLALP